MLNKKISKDGNRAELDVLVTASSKIIVYECKGKKPEQLVTGNEIKKWKDKIAFIYKYFKADTENANRNIVFNFWTTSDFSEEANTEFEKMNISRYTVEKKSGHEVYDFSKRLNLEEIAGILKQYFIR